MLQQIDSELSRRDAGRVRVHGQAKNVINRAERIQERSSAALVVDLLKSVEHGFQFLSFGVSLLLFPQSLLLRGRHAWCTLLTASWDRALRGRRSRYRRCRCRCRSCIWRRCTRDRAYATWGYLRKSTLAGSRPDEFGFENVALVGGTIYLYRPKWRCVNEDLPGNVRRVLHGKRIGEPGH